MISAVAADLRRLASGSLVVDGDLKERRAGVSSFPRWVAVPAVGPGKSTCSHSCVGIWHSGPAATSPTGIALGCCGRAGCHADRSAMTAQGRVSADEWASAGLSLENRFKTRIHWQEATKRQTLRECAGTGRGRSEEAPTTPPRSRRPARNTNKWNLRGRGDRRLTWGRGIRGCEGRHGAQV